MSDSGAAPESNAAAGRAVSGATRPRHAYERAFYGEGDVLTPESTDELLEIVRDSQARGRMLVPEGAGRHAYLGVPPSEAVVVSTQKLQDVLRYEPDDFTIGVQAGLPLVEFTRTLRENGQEIPIDVSSRTRGTVGGWIAAGFSGLRASQHGSLRNYVIGSAGLRGGDPPSVFKTGGMVVKNVAGYDVSKFLIGSLGTAGIILETNFKVRAIADRRTFRVARFQSRGDAWAAARRLREPAYRPALLVALGGTAPEHLKSVIPELSSDGHWVVWSFEGHSSQVEWQESQVDRILDEASCTERMRLTEAQVPSVRDALCEFGEPGGDAPPQELGIARIGVLPTEADDFEDELLTRSSSQSSLAAVTDVLTGSILLRWRIREAPHAGVLPELRDLVAARQATGVILYVPPAVRRELPFSLREDPAAPLARRIRDVFDPHCIFCPGRKHPK